MKKIKTGALAIFFLPLSLVTACVVHHDISEDVHDRKQHVIDAAKDLKGRGTDCDSRNTQQDLPGAVNLGELDDRNCKFDYQEVTFKDSDLTWGKYELIENASTDAQNYTRMERKFAPRLIPFKGNFHRFVALYRIADVDNERGTYIIQAKGKHLNSVNDPAIALFQARKKRVNGELYFDIYREQITKRGGRFSNGGREDVFLTRVKAMEVFRLEMVTGFTYKGQKIDRHYVNVKINDTWYNYDVPEPQAAFETGLRYGAYEVRTGRAEIYVANTFFEQK